MQVMSALPLKCSVIGSIGSGSHADASSDRRSQGFNHVSPAFPRIKYPLSDERGTNLQQSCPSFCGIDGRRSRRRSCFEKIRSSSSSSSPSSSSRVGEEDEVVFEGSPEGSIIEDEEQAREDLMKMVRQRLSEDDLKEAAKKYNYEDELFSRIDFAQINAFTNKAFSGNPAAVCYLPYEKNEKWFQLVAREFNLPATAFVVKRRESGNGQASSSAEGAPASLEVEDDGAELGPVKNLRRIENEFDIRWFTATSELELCGHGTLASAHMLFSSGLVEGDTIIFHSKKGTVLEARKVSGYDEPDVAKEEEEDPKARVQSKVELGKGVIELDFPIGAASEVDASEAKAVSDALGGVETVWVGRTAIGDYLVELPSSKHVEELQPQFEKMTDFSGRGGVIATARASKHSGLDVVSRFFVPKAGILEDPVTGSAHCTLGPYWAAKLGKDTLKAYQASPRGGEVFVRVDSGAGRAYLQGGAVLVMAGTLLNTFQV